MKLPRKELRDVSISLRLSQTERDHLAQLTEHYKTSNAGLIAWLLAREIEALDKNSVEEFGKTGGPDLPSGLTLEELADRIAILEKAIGQK